MIDRTEGSHVQVFRHVHPREVWALAGIPPNMSLGSDMRLALAVTGQVASPIQSVWVGACVRKAVDLACGREPSVSPQRFWQHIRRALRKPFWISGASLWIWAHLPEQVMLKQALLCHLKSRAGVRMS